MVVVSCDRSYRSELRQSQWFGSHVEKETEAYDTVFYETFLSRAEISAISFRYGCCSRYPG